jgi:hypothetical protein
MAEIASLDDLKAQAKKLNRANRGTATRMILLRGLFGAAFRGTRAAQAALMRPLAPV